VIPQPYITEWSAHAPWPAESQIEQDLILSRLIVEIASDELLANELAFRGGTCLHKLHLPGPARYSEDLDYTRTSDEPRIGDCLTALRRIAADIGLEERKRAGSPATTLTWPASGFAQTPRQTTGRSPSRSR
jgi:predicted nucleotidyltransferase component of viral defense system